MPDGKVCGDSGLPLSGATPWDKGLAPVGRVGVGEGIAGNTMGVMG